MVVLSDTCDAVISRHGLSPERRLALYVDDDRAVIGLYDKTSGKDVVVCTGAWDD